MLAQPCKSYVLHVNSRRSEPEVARPKSDLRLTGRLSLRDGSPLKVSPFLRLAEPRFD